MLEYLVQSYIDAVNSNNQKKSRRIRHILKFIGMDMSCLNYIVRKMERPDPNLSLKHPVCICHRFRNIQRIFLNKIC